MPNDLLKVSEEYAENTIRVAKGMKENSRDGYVLDYDLIIAACEAGYISANSITEVTIQLVQDIRVLMQFAKEKYFTYGLTCVKKENNTYFFEDDSSKIIIVQYNVLEDLNPKIYKKRKNSN